MAIIKNKKKCVGRDVGKLVGMYNSAAAVEKQASGSKKKKITHEITLWSSNPTSGHVHRRTESGGGDR